LECAAVNRRGQVSIEFILLIVIVLVYIYMTVWPLMEDATASADDVKRVSETKIGAMKIANALNEAAVNSGDSRKTISILVPVDAAIECNGTDERIEYSINIKKMHGRRAPLDKAEGIGCEELGRAGEEYYSCQSFVSLLSGAVPTECGSIQITGPLFDRFVVEKIGEDISVKRAG